MRHLSPETLLDVADGAVPETAEPHLAECVACRQQVADLKFMMASIEVDVPEPSPLFWDHLSERVRAAAAAEQPLSGFRWTFRHVAWTLGAAASAAAIIMAVSLTAPSTSDRSTMPAPSVASESATASVGSNDDDPSLDLLVDLTGDLDLDAAAEAGMTMDIGDADEALMDLSDTERVELRRLLHEAMSGSGA